MTTVGSTPPADTGEHPVTPPPARPAPRPKPRATPAAASAEASPRPAPAEPASTRAAAKPAAAKPAAPVTPSPLPVAEPAAGAPSGPEAASARESRAPGRRERRRLAAAAAAAARPPLRRVRHRVKSVDLWSVLKISLCFYICAVALLLLTGVLLWLFVGSVGWLEDIEGFVGDLFNSRDFRFLGGQILEGAALIGLVLAALLVVITVVAAALYNVFSELLGGVEFSTIEEEQPARPR